ncbi:2-octaprenyl-6-methoxyphenyl hydroxylase [Methylohalobius crimeensis]|uniref:2-octaprenyl-6-methoxyphenyl hydroxylase n=1 Tax=Methylohalobius crimeensis TaxID=244365 RepID=UPI0003B7AE13|nr:2-octaprenyl-6-methoxyphenyl hydroxylase [Methylohalobius crimeensis]
MKTYDVLIVGGGLAGASLALALEPLGLKIALVEAIPATQRSASPSGDRALALAKGSVEIFQELGIWSEVRSRATPIEHIQVSDRGHFGKTRLHARDMGVEAFGQVIAARDLEAALAGACERGGMEILCPARVSGLEVVSDAVEVSLLRDEQALHCRARLVVAADGGQSKVRQWVGIGQQVHHYGQIALVSTVRSELPHHFTAYERFTPSGPLALLPLTRGNSALIWTHSIKEARMAQAMPTDRFEQRLQKTFGWKLGRLNLVVPVRGFPLRLIRADRLFSERVALVGNAAHQLHPVAGQGFNLGLRDVAVLARLLTEQVQRKGDPGAFTLLERYARLRASDHNRIIGFSDGLVRWFLPSLPPLALARNLGLVALDHWMYGKRAFARHAMGMAGVSK